MTYASAVGAAEVARDYARLQGLLTEIDQATWHPRHWSSEIGVLFNRRILLTRQQKD